jgi:Kef-type K+ transport system membrane component KefB/nucleotide-binding universal stress UspA family protein
VPSEHQLLLFWLQLLALLLFARVLGGAMRAIGQPAVIGELAAGLVLGPSVLGHVVPGLHAWLFPDDPLQRALLAGPAWIGVFLLLILTGSETDLGLIRRLGWATGRVAIGSLVFPVAAGVGLGLVLPAEFLGERAQREVFALFMGTALGISALPVIAKILSDLDLMRRNVAQVLLAAAMADDIAGWILLGMVAGLAQSGSLDAARLAVTIGGLAVFLALAFTVGQRGVDALLRGVLLRRWGAAASLTAVLLVALAAGATTHAIGLEAVFGAFIAGIVLGRSRFHEAEALAQLDGVTRSFFAPLFFATAGLRVDLGLLRDPEVLGWGLAVVAAASVSKAGGAYLGSLLAGLPRREGLALGVGLNARGAVEIVVATVGLSIGVLNPSSYTVVVLLAIVTSMMAPPLLRLVIRDWPGSDEEQARLAQERQLGGNVLVHAGRVLLPSHGGPNSVLAARLVHLAWPDDAEVTILAAGRDVPSEDLAKVHAALAGRVTAVQDEPGKEPLAAILAQAALGYGAVAVGATDERIAGTLVSPVVDELLASSPLPVVMVRRGSRLGPEATPRFRRILVPAVGTRPGRAAQEIAYGVAKRHDARVLLAHVVTTPSIGNAFGYRYDGAHSPRADVAERVLEEARALANEMGVRVEPVIRSGVSAAEEILQLARESHVDLLVLAANLRQFTGRPFLGHGVEYLLEEAEATVVVVTAPPGWGLPAARRA